MTLDCKKFFSISNHSRPSGYKFRFFPLYFFFCFVPRCFGDNQIKVKGEGDLKV